MASTEDVAAALSDLPAEAMSAAIEQALTMHIGAGRSYAVGALIADALDEDRQVERQSGPARRVSSHLAEAHQQLAIRSAAHRAVLAEPLLESAAVSEALGRRGSNAREAASTLRRQGRLLGLQDAESHRQNRYLFPEWQLDFAERRVRPVVDEVNTLLDAKADPWGVASWWISDSPRLRGDSPRDLLGSDREDEILALARAEAGE